MPCLLGYTIKYGLAFNDMTEKYLNEMVSSMSFERAIIETFYGQNMFLVRAISLIEVEADDESEYHYMMKYCCPEIVR